MKWLIDFIIILLMMIICFNLGRMIGKTDCKVVTDELQRCEMLWKLDVDLFYPELCKTVCVEEFEKMAC